MSFLGGSHLQSTEAPTVAGIDASDTSSNQEAVPIGWWIGPGKRPLTWIISEPFDIEDVPITTTTGAGKGSSSTTTGYKRYCSVAGIAGPGLGRRVRKMVSGNTVVWEGDVVRNDDPSSPDYWRAHITTSVCEAYVYWGRPDQPLDDILLARINAAKPDNPHPPYRHQILVVLVKYYCGDNTETVPNTWFDIPREPQPEVGTFAVSDSDQGESMIAGLLELATNPLFGAGLDGGMFEATECEALSADIIADLGHHAPTLDRAQPLRDVFAKLQLYYGGWARIQNGKVRLGRWPHNGAVPDNLTELSIHDFTARPQVKAGSPSTTINDVFAKWRDPAANFKEKPAEGSASENVEARRNFETATTDLTAFLDGQQAQRWVDTAAAAGAEGSFEGSGPVRRPRAVRPDGADLVAGDNFQLDLTETEVDQVARITRRTDYYDGKTEIEFSAEPGVYPTPYVPPADLRPPGDDDRVPNAIASARIWELTPALYGSPIGLPIAVLAKRPLAVGDVVGIESNSVVGFNIHLSATGSSYDVLGYSRSFALRGTLRTALGASADAITVQLALDADNLDRSRLAAQSNQARDDNTLLILIGDEIFSAGALTIAGLNHDFACLRARADSLAAAHAAGAEAWIIFRRELQAFVHAQLIENTDRYFKLQPFTRAGTTRELSDCPAITYHFRDRAPEKPIVLINALPAGLVAGVSYGVTGQISDVNGDLDHYVVEAALLTGPGGTIDSKVTLDAADFESDEKALFALKTVVNFALAGTWRIIVRAYDSTGKYTRVQTAELTVAVSSGGYGADDGVTPDSITVVTITPGLTELVVEWSQPINTPIRATRIYESTTSVRPVLPLTTVPDPQAFFFRRNLPAGATRNFWFEPEGRNGRLGAITGPFSGTTRAGVDLSDLVPGMETVGIVAALPNPVGYTGPKNVLLTTDGKLYRLSGGAWIKTVAAADVSGQLTSTQIADDAITTPKLAANAVTANELAANSVIAGKIAAAAVTATAIGANEVIANTANLKDLVVTGAKLADATIGTAKIADAAITNAKIANLAVDTAQLDNLSVTTGKIADAAITNAKIGNAAITNAKIADATITDAKIANLAVNKLTGGTISGEVFILSPTGVIKSADYVPDVSGLFLDGAGNAELNTIKIRVSTLVTATGTANVLDGSTTTICTTASKAFLARLVNIAFACTVENHSGTNATVWHLTIQLKRGATVIYTSLIWVYTVSGGPIQINASFQDIVAAGNYQYSAVLLADVWSGGSSSPPYQLDVTSGIIGVEQLTK